MKIRKIKNNVSLLGAIDWNRRLFDSLIPLPHGTSYNAYLVEGSEKTALIDTVDLEKSDVLLRQLESVKKIDYIIIQHCEQDHSGAARIILEKYLEAEIICSPKAKPLIVSHLNISEEKITVIEDEEVLSLGDKSLKFLVTPWVHWPDTMCTYLEEDKILFTCDFLGSHIATSDLFAIDEVQVYEAAKRYYAEIMMPFRGFVRKNLEKVQNYKIDCICPSHGPLYNKPSFILDAYNKWTNSPQKKDVVIPYISMHGSTEIMVNHLAGALAEKNISVHLFDLSVTDIGELAKALVDASTIVLGTPTVLAGPHPTVMYAAILANALRPTIKYASIIGSLGWAGKSVEKLADAIPNLKAEIIEPVLCKGIPDKETFEKLDKLAETIAQKLENL